MYLMISDESFEAPFPVISSQALKMPLLRSATVEIEENTPADNISGRSCPSLSRFEDLCNK